jgi:hypothetical protein
MWQTGAAQDSDYQRYTLPEIVVRITATGFIPKRATYANALPALYAWLKRLVQLRYLRRHQNRSLYEGLVIRDTGSQHLWLNLFLLWILKAEAAYLSAPDRKLVFGHSTFCLGIKPPDEPASPL